MDEIENQGQDLDGYRDSIFGVLNRSAIEIGDLLIAAKYRHPRQFQAWVEQELPFDLGRARQLMAISRGLRELPPEKRELLPSPASTLFTLASMDSETRLEALNSGEIHPKMTNSQAMALAGVEPAPKPAHRGWKSGPPEGAATKTRPPVSLLVTQLLRYDLEEIDPTSRARLTAWLTGDQHGIPAPAMVGGSELRRD